MKEIGCIEKPFHLSLITSWVYCTDEPWIGSVILCQMVNNNWCAKIIKYLLCAAISTSLRKENGKIQILSHSVFCYTQHTEKEYQRTLTFGCWGLSCTHLCTMWQGDGEKKQWEAGWGRPLDPESPSFSAPRQRSSPELKERVWGSYNITVPNYIQPDSITVVKKN